MKEMARCFLSLLFFFDSKTMRRFNYNYLCRVPFLFDGEHNFQTPFCSLPFWPKLQKSNRFINERLIWLSFSTDMSRHSIFVDCKIDNNFASSYRCNGLLIEVLLKNFPSFTRRCITSIQQWFNRHLIFRLAQLYIRCTLRFTAKMFKIEQGQ